ncbi:MAG: hypothetical protein CMJ64_28725 [Planctomycetaceae bacterium]|nr:hypothetical protein [Planctomycetaceae bacterium]
MKTMIDVRHTNIVQLYNAGKNGPYCWAAMEFIDGEDLTKVINRIGIEGMLGWREVYRVAVHTFAACPAALIRVRVASSCASLPTYRRTLYRRGALVGL